MWARVLSWKLCWAGHLEILYGYFAGAGFDLALAQQAAWLAETQKVKTINRPSADDGSLPSLRGSHSGRRGHPWQKRAVLQRRAPPCSGGINEQQVRHLTRHTLVERRVVPIFWSLPLPQFRPPTPRNHDQFDRCPLDQPAAGSVWG